MSEYRLRVSLSHPPGKNERHKLVWRFDNQGHRYKGLALSEASKAWMDEAILAIRAARNRQRVPTLDDPWIAVISHLYTQSLDHDAPLSLAIDAMAVALGINDALVALSVPVKHVVKAKREQKIILDFLLHPIAPQEERETRTTEISTQIGRVLGWS